MARAPCFSRRDDDLSAVLGLGGDADDVGLFAGEHLSVVSVLLVRGDAVARADSFHHLGAQVRTGDEVRALASLVPSGVGVRAHISRDFVIDESPHAAATDENSFVLVHLLLLYQNLGTFSSALVITSNRAARPSPLAARARWMAGAKSGIASTRSAWAPSASATCA